MRTDQEQESAFQSSCKAPFPVQTGALGTVYAYSPYGEVAILGPDGGNDLQYGGLRNDGTELYQATYRYYDPILKQWISDDPIGMRGGINQRAYTGGNPISFSDPRGLDWFRPAGATNPIGRQGFPGWQPTDPGMIFAADFVPGAYELGILHDSFVDEQLAAGRPDWLVNIPTIQYFYFRAVAMETFRSIDELFSKLAKVRVPFPTLKSAPHLFFQQCKPER